MAEEQSPWHETTPWENAKRLKDRIFGGLNKAGADSGSTIRQRENLNESGNQASDFADQGQAGYAQMGAESAASRDFLRQQASGQHSVSAEQLRQGLQQNLASQRSMAASASPNNSAMASRTAAIQGNRAAYGMSGQQAQAGLVERQNAQAALSDMILKQRQQDAQVALGSRGNAIEGYKGVAGEKSDVEKWAGPVAGGFMAMSDRRVKADIEDGDAKAKRTLEGLKAYSYRYKDEKHGKGKQFGPMAQEMEKAGLGHAVEDTPDGKAVNGAKTALSSLALTAALARRVSKLEGDEK